MKEAWLRTDKKGENEYEISIRVTKEHQGKDIGTGLLKEVINEADNEEVILYAEPVPSDFNENNRKRLIKLYRRFGFEFQHLAESGDCGKMIRKPHI